MDKVFGGFRNTCRISHGGQWIPAAVICKSSLTARRQENRYGTMSDWLRQKFLSQFHSNERFLNIYSVADNFKLIARGCFTPVYQGRNCCEIFLCQHLKFFFRIRQKSMNGLMAFGDKGMRVEFLASNSWRDGGLQRALLQGRGDHGN
ncbi:hypothetical protein [Pseudomonas putida]|uniref:hypothetical protein n=1 Tax=Pseudomonas putida TaxID=303 RepID=UPI00117BBFAF|nr:hypothetical protein [Pseudomonas putida]